MRFTVFTPTYNRGRLLIHIYESLQRQTFTEFEWVIVDDGSQDDTEEIVKGFQNQDNFFPIIYKKVQNGGKHRAWNKGVDLASGELFFGCDSDDYLTDDALENADIVEKGIPQSRKKEFAGVCGLKGYRNSGMVGETFTESSQMDITHLERIKNGVSGDKAEVIYTSVWKKYKYFEFEGEKFITEATALNRMAADGLKMRYFNSVLKIIEYRADGLSANSGSIFLKNPKGWGLYIHQQIKYHLLTGNGKWDVITNYYYRCRDRLSIKEMAQNLHMNIIPLFCGIQMTRLRYRLGK